ncbi:MAG: response regulator, partial [Alphaproteobacteria bacterium]|nr:response regulator [Alphaproteobacteria bacterium]
LLAIINDILDVTKLEAGKIELERLPVNPSSLVDSALALVRAEAAAKGLSVQIAFTPDVPKWIEADPTRLRQILINLLSNAVKFTERGGIVVAVSRARAGGAERLRVAVTDTGSGIAPEAQQRLFQNFVQADRSISRRFGGTGLGLAICKRLAEAMGGDIGVESEIGRGSRFWFTLALIETEAPAAADPALPAAMAGGESRVARVLVADDIPVNCTIIRGILERAGHEVVFAQNGAEAVQAVQALDFDIVFMDMEMPVMDGIAATQAIRALGERVRDIPIIALTANAMTEEAARCRAAGMNDHLAKPIDRARLLAALRHWSGDAIARDTLQRPRSAMALAVDHAVLDELEAILGTTTLRQMATGLRARLDRVPEALTTSTERERLAFEAHDLVSAAAISAALNWRSAAAPSW